jgi:glycosyltransferase involved in cell wall biosynthesis
VPAAPHREQRERVRARDAARLRFLAAAPRWLQVGFSGRDPPHAEARRTSSRLSSQLDEEVRAALTPENVAVCVVVNRWTRRRGRARDRGPAPRASRGPPHLEKFRRPVFCSPAVRRQLVDRIARYRLFEKRNVPPPRLPPARVYPVREPLRVGIQVDGLDRGGLEQIVCDLVRSLDPARVRPTVLVHAREAGQGGRALREAGVDIFVTGGDERRLVSAVDERRIAVVNLHHSIAGTSAYASRGIATAYTVHSSYAWMNGVDRAVRASSLQAVDLFVAVSRQVERFFEATLGIDPRRVRVVPNGLDPRELAGVPPASREALGLSPSDFVFLQVGSLYPAKLQEVTVRAFRCLAPAVPQARLVLVGNVLDPEYAKEVERACADEAVRDRVRLLPWRSRREIAAMMQCADCFLLPSLVEGWSIALMEAMYFELPLVVTDVGSAREVIRDGDIGIVLPNPYERLSAMRPSDLSALARRYPERNLDALVAAMREMTERPEAWRARARAGGERVRSQLDIGTMARAYECAFEDAWRRARKPVRAAPSSQEPNGTRQGT